MVKWVVLFSLLIISGSCIKLGEPFKGIPPGMWRGVLYLSDKEENFDEKTEGQLPFTFEVVYDTPDSFHIVIHNGDERILVTDITMGIDRRVARDTINIQFPIYDSYITAQYEEDAIEGWWVVRNRKDYRIQFKALHGQPYRFFQTLTPPVSDLTGRWDCMFEIETEHPYRAIGDFVQKGNIITGTFMTNTGDDRYLEGVVNGDRLHLSVFDGSHAYLYEAKIVNGELSGIYRSGIHYKTYWNGKKSDTLSIAVLGDPLTLTQMKKDEVFSLALLTPDGTTIDISKGTYAGKPKIIQVMGTWCPNCKDETTYLLEYLQKHPDPGFEILGVAFERHTEVPLALASLKTYKEKMKISYPIVYGGSNDKNKAAEALPMLNKVVAFPTMIFLDADNKVVAIHTGFAGPATSGYEDFKKEFEVLVQKMKSKG